MSKRKALLLMVLVTLIWSTNGLLIKLVSWSPMSISGLRSLFAAAVLLPFLGKPRHLVSFDTLVGGSGFAGALMTFVIATKLTTAANAIFLQLTAPVYVALLSGWILGERVRVLFLFFFRAGRKMMHRSRFQFWATSSARFWAYPLSSLPDRLNRDGSGSFPWGLSGPACHSFSTQLS